MRAWTVLINPIPPHCGCEMGRWLQRLSLTLKVVKKWFPHLWWWWDSLLVANSHPDFERGEMVRWRQLTHTCSTSSGAGQITQACTDKCLRSFWRWADDRVMADTDIRSPSLWWSCVSGATSLVAVSSWRTELVTLLSLPPHPTLSCHDAWPVTQTHKHALSCGVHFRDPFLLLFLGCYFVLEDIQREGRKQKITEKYIWPPPPT